MKTLILSLVMLAALSPDQQLIEASLQGENEAIAAALSRGANIEVRHTERELSPLMLAIYRDHILAVEQLLLAGANPNARNGRGHTPLIMAAAGGQLPIVKLLVRHGAEIDAIEEIGNTALMWAAFWGHLEVIDWLLSEGSDVQARNQDGNQALLLAAQGGVAPRTRALVGSKSKPFTPAGRLLPQAFGMSEDLRLIQTLLLAGADPNSVNHAGQSALMLFAENGKDKAVRTLLHFGAQPELRDQQGLQAQAYADRKGHHKLAVWLRQQARKP